MALVQRVAFAHAGALGLRVALLTDLFELHPLNHFLILEIVCFCCKQHLHLGR
jgi:hypothetical protein